MSYDDDARIPRHQAYSCGEYAKTLPVRMQNKLQWAAVRMTGYQEHVPGTRTCVSGSVARPSVKWDDLCSCSFACREETHRHPRLSIL
jgi:hypothetical protein